VSGGHKGGVPPHSGKLLTIDLEKIEEKGKSPRHDTRRQTMLDKRGGKKKIFSTIRSNASLTKPKKMLPKSRRAIVMGDWVGTGREGY